MNSVIEAQEELVFAKKLSWDGCREGIFYFSDYYKDKLKYNKPHLTLTSIPKLCNPIKYETIKNTRNS